MQKQLTSKTEAMQKRIEALAHECICRRSCRVVMEFVITRGTFAPASEGERAKNMRAAIIPTGKNRIINGGGGSGGKINGSTSIDAAKTLDHSAGTKRIQPQAIKSRSV
uniref:Uncharacterized protein n=1 Tax=Salix viminalis TaxID=40686 RepID=A0A6N2MMP0_SALVM